MALEESAKLYTVLLAGGHKRSSGEWRVATAAADGLGALIGRAQVVPFALIGYAQVAYTACMVDRG